MGNVANHYGQCVQRCSPGLGSVFINLCTVPVSLFHSYWLVFTCRCRALQSVACGGPKEERDPESLVGAEYSQRLN